MRSHQANRPVEGSCTWFSGQAELRSFAYFSVEQVRITAVLLKRAEEETAPSPEDLELQASITRALNSLPVGSAGSATSADIASGREAIPKVVQYEVWRRDQGQCVQCGSRERLEFDHIIPRIKGGSNTSRNVQLLCEQCNRAKSDRL